jgi:hypothetical protein
MMQFWQFWQNTPLLMILSFPVLYAVLLLFVHAVVEFAPRYIRQHRVSYRPIQTRVADLLLIIRLAFQKQ